MIGIDANVLLRFYVEDEGDPKASKQRRAAAHLFAGTAQLFVPKTVLLECEWVMRAVYGFPAQRVVQAFDHLRELPNVRIEDAEAIDRALNAYRLGIDFADAMHLAACHDCETFATFDDRQFARRAARLGLEPPCRVPRP